MGIFAIKKPEGEKWPSGSEEPDNPSRQDHVSVIRNIMMPKTNPLQADFMTSDTIS